jgi:uncharacterized membrane protein
MSGEQDFAFLRALEKEADLWLTEGLISREQRDAILARYRMLKEADEKAGSGKLIATITVLGAVLIGIGILLFVGANWYEIPKWGKLGIIFSTMIASYGAGFYLRFESKNYPKAGAALIFLGSMVFGAGIFLIAQIYHITVHYPNGPLLWGIGVLPLAYLLGFRTILTLSLADLLIWLGMEASFHLSLPYDGFLPFVALYLTAGIALWTVGLMHSGFDRLKKLAGPPIVLGVLVTFGSCYILTFDIFRAAFAPESLTPFYGGIIALFVASGILYLTSPHKAKGWTAEILVPALFMVTAVLVILVAGKTPPAARSLPRILMNIVFAFGVVGIIVLGYVQRQTSYINIGLIFFVLDVIARYFDFFWKLLPRSVFFIVGGIILLLGGSLLEKKRRRVLASFHAGGEG